MKSRFPSKLQICSYFGLSFILEGLWMCVYVRACVFYSRRILLFRTPYKNRPTFFRPRWFLMLFFLVMARIILLLTALNVFLWILSTLAPNFTRLFEQNRYSKMILNNFLSQNKEILASQKYPKMQLRVQWRQYTFN